MADLNVADIFTAIGSIITPIILLFLTRRIEKARKREEQQRERQEKLEEYWRKREEQLRDDRIQIYDAILEPFIFALAKGEHNDKKYRNKTKQEVLEEIMLSLEYKQTGFKLTIMGSDPVVKAYNELMQFFFSNPDFGSNKENTWKLIDLLGNFLLEIRKSVGSENTTLNHIDMLEWMITDIRKQSRL